MVRGVERVRDAAGRRAALAFAAPHEPVTTMLCAALVTPRPRQRVWVARDGEGRVHSVLVVERIVTD